MRVTLTFDNGPDIEGTPAVLKALAERHIPAVFFVVGQKVRAHPELLARTSAAGHLIGNHTWSHSVPFGEADEAGFARTEIVSTQEAIKDVAGASNLFRPVGADPGAVIDSRLLDEEALETLIDGHFTLVLWNVVPHDWERPHDWIVGAVDECRRVEHAVVVLHDGHPAGLNLLPAFLDDLIEAGAEFRTDFPPACTPILNGAPTPGIDALVTTRSVTPIDTHSSNLKEQS